METVARQRPIEKPATHDTHDLPVLAALQAAKVVTPWESLLEDGVQPSLILGAERRSGGGR
jgi:hypothetical protein